MADQQHDDQAEDQGDDDEMPLFSEEAANLHGEIGAINRRMREAAASVQSKGEAGAMGAHVLRTVAGDYGTVLQELVALVGAMAEQIESDDSEGALIDDDDAEELYTLLGTIKGLFEKSIEDGATPRSDALDTLLAQIGEKMQWVLDRSDWEPAPAETQSPA